MTISVLPLNLMRIPVTIIHVIAIGATLTRIRLRVRRQSYWWDDGLATLAMSLDVLYLITFWLRNNNAADSPPNILNLYIILNWFHLMLGTTVLWLSRLSIMIGINRLLLPWGTLRKIAMLMPFTFVVFWLVVMSQKIWVCARTDAWHKTQPVQCLLEEPVPSVELSLDIIADCILFVIPVCILSDLHLSRTKRRLVSVIFASCIFTTMSNIVYVTFVLGSIKWNTHLLVSVSAHIEASVSLLVSNLSILIPAAFRTYRRVRHIQTQEDENAFNHEEIEIESYFPKSHWTTTFSLLTSMATMRSTPSDEPMRTNGEEAYDVSLPAQAGS